MNQVPDQRGFHLAGNGVNQALTGDWQERLESSRSLNALPQPSCFLVGFAFVSSLTEVPIYWRSSVET
jgi:hypothetical protein